MGGWRGFLGTAAAVMVKIFFARERASLSVCDVLCARLGKFAALAKYHSSLGQWSSNSSKLAGTCLLASGDFLYERERTSLLEYLGR